ncbi:MULTISPECIES: hypothetical protein [Streptomyces]|uniref:hypothetical protein n=2 Tax=Streptomyces TaxID=1883 RepID=UPI0004BD4A63|nr:hypothetical protein [Streptomyces griseolus]
MATEREHIGASGPEGHWTANGICRRWQRFFEQKPSLRGLIRLEFTEHIAYLLFLKLDHERVQAQRSFQVVLNSLS